MKKYSRIDVSSNLLKEQAYQKILNDIKTCLLYPGEHIVINELSNRYEIGVTPIRDALQQLVSDGLIIPVPRFGYIIMPVISIDVEELFEVRLIIETATVKLAVQRARDSTLDEIFRMADFSYDFQDRNSYHIFLQNNFTFHNSIAEASGNRRLVDMLNATNTQLDRVYYLGLDLQDNADEMKFEHLELVKALRQRDLKLAEESITEQIIRSRERVLHALLKISDVML